MTLSARAAAVLLASFAATAFAAPPAGPAAAKPAAAPPAVRSAPETLATERDRISYMVGLDVAQSIAPVAPDLDMPEFIRAIRNAFAGNKPLITQQQAAALQPTIIERIKARNGQAVPGAKVPEVSKQQVAHLVGADIGRSLAPLKDEIDLDTAARAMSTVFAGGKPLMDEAARDALRRKFTEGLRQKMQARRAAASTTNREAGARFLAENRAKKGVFVTPSGLQYMVLRQGSGARPRATDRVRVHYHGTLLDGTVFDSSYERGQPAEFALNQVIAGWTEGVGMMPVGAKYRFWIPSQLGYGEQGSGEQIGPNATLVFDVELLSIAQ